MRKPFALVVATTIFLSACKKNINDEKQTVNATDQQDQKISPQQINDFIMKKWSEKGSFNWNEASDLIIWSALQNSDKIISVG